MLNVLRTVLEGFDSVLCVGCPSVFEEFRKEKNAFMLDYDHRFVRVLKKLLSNSHFSQTSIRRKNLHIMVCSTPISIKRMASTI